jgi:hypothetical protein
MAVTSAGSILVSLLCKEYAITEYGKSQYKVTSLAENLVGRKFSYTLTAVICKCDS